MPTVLVRHRVANYAAWKPVFDEHRATREANGARGGRVFCSAGDPNEVLIFLEWDDVERARLYLRSADLSDAMVRAGVSERPDFWILEETGEPPATSSTA